MGLLTRGQIPKKEQFYMLTPENRAVGYPRPKLTDLRGDMDKRRRVEHPLSVNDRAGGSKL